MTTNADSYVPIEDLAQHLSVKVSTIRSWVHNGFISPTAYIKVGNTYRFNITDVVESLKTQKPQIDPVPVEGQIHEQMELNFDDTEDH
jgi:excisionase family DNA binding protein